MTYTIVKIDYVNSLVSFRTYTVWKMTESRSKALRRPKIIGEMKWETDNRSKTHSGYSSSFVIGNRRSLERARRLASNLFILDLKTRAPRFGFYFHRG